MKLFVFFLSISSLSLLYADNLPVREAISIDKDLFEAAENLDFEKFELVLKQTGPLCKDAKKILENSWVLKKSTSFWLSWAQSPSVIKLDGYRFAAMIAIIGSIVAGVNACANPRLARNAKLVLGISSLLAGLFGIRGSYIIVMSDEEEKAHHEQKEAKAKIIREKIDRMIKLLKQHPASDICA